MDALIAGFVVMFAGEILRFREFASLCLDRLFGFGHLYKR